jgi:hypothetical protein
MNATMVVLAVLVPAAELAGMSHSFSLLRPYPLNPIGASLTMQLLLWLRLPVLFTSLSTFDLPVIGYRRGSPSVSVVCHRK